MGFAMLSMRRTMTQNEDILGTVLFHNILLIKWIFCNEFSSCRLEKEPTWKIFVFVDNFQSVNHV